MLVLGYFEYFKRTQRKKQSAHQNLLSLVRLNHSRGKFRIGHTTSAQYVIERFIKDQLKNFYSKTIRTMKYIMFQYFPVIMLVIYA